MHAFHRVLLVLQIAISSSTGIDVACRLQLQYTPMHDCKARGKRSTFKVDEALKRSPSTLTLTTSFHYETPGQGNSLGVPRCPLGVFHCLPRGILGLELGKFQWWPRGYPGDEAMYYPGELSEKMAASPGSWTLLYPGNLPVRA